MDLPLVLDLSHSFARPRRDRDTLPNLNRKSLGGPGFVTLWVSQFQWGSCERIHYGKVAVRV